MKGHFSDLTGKKIGKFSVIKKLYKNKFGAVIWECRCDCGKIVTMASARLGSKEKSKNGCRKCFMKTFIKHGRSHTKEHKCWLDMKERCDNPKKMYYKDYGGRGIKYCERWKDFRLFFEDMGLAPTPSHTIERLDVNGDYCKKNCKWATQKEQSRNKRNSRFLYFNGKNKTISEWSEIYGLTSSRIGIRLKRGWPIEKAITTPSLGVYKGGSKKYCKI